jgi:hypothetical protein
MQEIWKDIIGYEGHYQISNRGRVKSLARKDASQHTLKECILKPNLNKLGYPLVSLCKDGQPKTYKIHRFVAIAFIPNPYDKPEVNHKSGVKLDNRAENLEWVTHQENINHKNTILGKNNKGQNHGMAKLTEVSVLQIRKSSLKIKELARMYQVSKTLIRLIKNKQLWRHI